MNCDELRDNLVELVYDELDDARRRQVLEHLARCPDCHAEVRGLRQARAALALHRAGEPADAGPSAWAAAPDRSTRARLWPSRWGAAAAGLAAMVAIALTVWLLTGPTTPLAFADPVAIERLNVSLTILSEPEQTPGRRYAARQQRDTQMLQPQVGGQVTYPGQMPPLSEILGWEGLALVRDQRVIRNLNQGVTTVRFRGVPWAIKPDTVRLRCVDEPGAMAILEQNYQYDLASASAVLKRYVDKEISVTFEAGGHITGTLLSFDGGNLVVRPEGEGPRNISRAEVKDVRFAKLPEGLLTTPTLMWRLHSGKPARRRKFEVAYMTAGLSWRADYVLKLRVAAGEPKADERDLPRIFDTADLIGYATVANHSGVTYKDAQLKLMAGDVNLVQEARAEIEEKLGWGGGANKPGAAPQFKEKSFFEYHLYTLARPTTIAAAETKQIQLVSGGGIRLRRGYLYDRTRHATAVQVVSEFRNAEANGLGKPLPKGVIRLYAPDPTGVDAFISKTTIDHAPKDEKIRLPWAHAFDIACAARRTNYRRRGPAEHHEDWAYSLRNHKDYDVTITVHVRVPATTYKFTCDRPWKMPAVGLVEIDVPVKRNTAGKLEFSYDYNTRGGGGLTSPIKDPRPRVAPPRPPRGVVPALPVDEVREKEAMKRRLEKEAAPRRRAKGAE